MITTNKNNHTLYLKTVKELLGKTFYIPNYQRGYRWTKSEVTALLDDLWEYSETKTSEQSSFYCLQPIVIIYRGDKGYEVVDGQQRLTTLYLILKYLGIKNSYALHYETRENSQYFLTHINTKEAVDTHVNNIDYYHMYQCYQAISDWFKNNNDEKTKLKIKQLLKADRSKPSAQVIWYELNNSDDSVAIFSRLNIGKIPLTNAELIKALFLKERKENDEDRVKLQQIHIAAEWDHIEKRLNEPKFWAFICPPALHYKYETRIDYIFELISKDRNNKEDHFSVFYYFNNKPSNDWLEVKSYFLTFEDWYIDHSIYHLIGFLVNNGMHVAEIKKYAEKLTKTAFKEQLRDWVESSLNLFTERGDNKKLLSIDDLNYDEHPKQIKNVLLLFNVLTLINTKESDARFPFDRYREEKWDIEHIGSVTQKKLTSIKERSDWLESIKNCNAIDLQEVSGLIVKYEKTLTDDAFEDLYKKIADKFEFDGKNKNSLSNLTLLDQGTNRGYKNALFPVKREYIIKNDMNSKFVPICTKNVFLKYYSKTRKDLISWTNDDANEYLEKIKYVINAFFLSQGEGKRDVN